jgi:putative flippase GtrA
MPTIVHRFARFAVVGAIATAVHTSVFTTGIEIARIDPVVANALAFVIAVLVGFALNRRWTFSAAGGPGGRLWRYFVSALAGLTISSTVMFLVTRVAHWSPYVGLVLSLVCVPPVTFALNHFWVFRHRPPRA